MASYDQLGPVNYYNPNICASVGPLATAFMEAHEYGHHYLGHVINHNFNAANPYVQTWIDRNNEIAADEYSVRYWISQNNKKVIQAAVICFQNLNNPGDATHLPSIIRANRIANLFFNLTGFNLFP